MTFARWSRAAVMLSAVGLLHGAVGGEASFSRDAAPSALRPATSFVLPLPSATPDPRADKNAHEDMGPATPRTSFDVTFEVTGLHQGNAVHIESAAYPQPLLQIAPSQDGTYSAGSFARGQQLAPSSPLSRSTCDSYALSQTAIDVVAEDVTVQVVCEDRFPDAVTYAPTATVPLPWSGGVLTNLTAYDGNLVYLENGPTAEADSTVVLFDQSGVVDQAPFAGPACSLFTEDGLDLYFFELGSLPARTGLHGVDQSVVEIDLDVDGGPNAAAWDGDHIELAMEN